MEKLRQALKTLSEAEKQLRVSNDKMTWLTAALLQLAPDKQYVLPSSSTSASFNQGLLTCPEGDVGRSTAIDHTNIYAGPHGLPRNANLGVDSDNNMAGTRRGKGPGEHTPDNHVLLARATRVNLSRYRKSDNEMIWQAVLEHIRSDSVRKMLAKEARLISVSLGTGKIFLLAHSLYITSYIMSKFHCRIHPRMTYYCCK